MISSTLRLCDAARKIHLTKETSRQLLKFGGFVVERRGEIYIKVRRHDMIGLCHWLRAIRYATAVMQCCINYFASGSWAKYGDQRVRVCLCFCLSVSGSVWRSHISKNVKISHKFLYMIYWWSWLGFPLKTVQYVM